ncbi:hypothetical protein NIES22_45810 [Calothrix brevissima NIES-22]|nr:hypothetical protein NIES22_45810 [Calothrix brevissima NIES-22]
MLMILLHFACQNSVVSFEAVLWSAKALDGTPYFPQQASGVRSLDSQVSAISLRGSRRVAVSVSYFGIWFNALSAYECGY